VKTPAFSTHARYVASLTQSLFDWTKSLHELGEGSRAVLTAAALLVDVEPPRGKKKPLARTLNMIHSLMGGQFSAQDEAVLQAVVAIQHRQIKKKHLQALDLDPIQQREALSLAGMLLIADGLDHSNSQSTTIQKVEQTPSKMWVVLEGPQAAADSAAAGQNASLWEKAGYPQVRFIETSQAQVKFPPYPERLETPGVNASDVLAEAGRKTMRFHFAEMLHLEPGSRQGEDIEALHDMRVATRRLRAAFEVFAQAFEPRALRPFLKGLRATGRALGLVRDLDVFMENARRYLDQLPEDQRQGLSPLLENWGKQRDEARQKLLVHLNSPEYLAFKRKFNVFLSTTGAGALTIPRDVPVPHQVCEIAPVLVYSRLGAVRAYDTYIATASLERLHALRIEFKKLRYSVEYFREVLGPEAKPVIDELKGLQDHLGDLNDANVAGQILQNFIDEHKGALTSEEVGAIQAYKDFRQAELERLRASFPETWARFERPEFRRNLGKALSEL
jgi:CHAD domain-containing protein